MMATGGQSQASVGAIAGHPRRLASLSYCERVEIIREDESNYGIGNPHSTLTLARFRGLIDEKVVRGLIECAEKQVDFVDFKLMILVRLLHFEYSEDQPLLGDAIKVMMTFPFWPVGSTHKCLQSFGFWSENHAFMFLSSAHLMHQKLYGAEEATEEKHKETKLLLGYLRAHMHPLFNGVYECLSQVYLPYTFSAMLNLIDFSQHDEVRYLALQLAHTIAEQLILGTTDQGVVSLTPSCRTFLRCRTRTWGHNANQLVLILTGLSVEPYRAQAVTGFMLTSTYQPREEALKTLLYGELLWQRVPISHRVGETDAVYADLEENEKMPFFWSAGLVTHPDYIERTRRFQHIFGLSQHPHLMPLSFLPRRWAHFFMQTMAHWSKGQNYTNVNLTVYKAPGGLMLSSIQEYNVSLCGFQQMPWMANISGVGVWSQSGSSTSKLAYFDITNIFSPCVDQLGKLLISAYAVPKYLASYGVTSFLEKSSFLHWPSQLFDEELRQCRSAVGGEVYWRNIPRAEDIDRDAVNSALNEDVVDDDELDFMQSRESQVVTELGSNEEDDGDDGEEEKADEVKDPTEKVASTLVQRRKEDDVTLQHPNYIGNKPENEKVGKEALAVGKVGAPKSSPKKKRGFSVYRLGKSISRRVSKMLGSADSDAAKNENGLFEGAWWIGRRGTCLVGALCTDVTHIAQPSRPADAVKLRPNSKGVLCPRRVCETKTHAWVIRVGSLRPQHARKRREGSADLIEASLGQSSTNSDPESRSPLPRGESDPLGVSEYFDSIEAFAHYCNSISIHSETKLDKTSGHIFYEVKAFDSHQVRILETSIDTDFE